MADPTTTTTPTTTVDLRHLERLLVDIGGDKAAMREILDAFLESAPRLLLDAEAASASGDADKYRRAVHTLKSSAAMFGAAPLSLLCRDAEARGDAGDLSGSREAVAAIQAEYARVETTLRSWSL